jgi:hypothetical protein
MVTLFAERPDSWRTRVATGQTRIWVICNLLCPAFAGHEEWLDYHQYEDIRTLINNRQNNRRRGRGGGPRPNGANPGNDRGNRIDNRARGNANQLFEKYKTLARDAQMQGDRVMSEYYFQFADHYFRVLSENRPRFDEQNRGRPDQNDRDDQFDYGDDDGGQDNAAPAYANHRGYGQPQAQAAPAHEPVDAMQPDMAEPYGANGHAASAEPVAEERGGRGRRPRARRDEASPDLLANVDETAKEETRIEVDRLPPAFAAPEGEDAVDKPKRRGRRPRAESAAEL